ncbi:unnamed protein product [Hymenolepis diminuta]|uniref:C2H2-type domain-containing protein n=1 Tax=Hymenolepis diminuta TaxID=6216 RepID=A0A0R3SFK2_HYMDI|nr:unnamed protein product [Hymenolepis diminuta]
MNQVNANMKDMGEQIIQLENTEMANGVLTPEQYLELLCLYLRLDRIMDAKFLWKRVPNSMKATESPLFKIWSLTVFLLKKQNSQFISACQELLKSSNIPPSILTHISAVYQRIQCSTVNSIKSSYSSISLEKLSSLLSLAPNEAGTLMRDWTLSSDGVYLIEPSKVHQQQTEALPNRAGLEQTSVSGSLRLECPLCAFHTTDSIGLRRHAWREHLSDESATTTTFQSRIVLCCECGAATTDASSLQDHYSIVHGIDDPDARVKIRWITLSRSAVATEPTTTLSNPTFLPPFAPAIKPPSVTAEDLENNYEDDDNEELDDNECAIEEPSTSDFSPPLIESLREDCASSSSPPTIHTSTPVVSVVPESQDWSQLISRVEKKFSCLLCANSSPSVYYYNGRTEVVFHVVTRHLLRYQLVLSFLPIDH